MFQALAIGFLRKSAIFVISKFVLDNSVNLSYNEIELEKKDVGPMNR